LNRFVALGCVLFGTHSAFGAENERIVEAFNWTVVFLMGMPYVILAGVAGWIFYHYSRSRRKKVADERGSSLRLVKKESLEDE